MIISARKARKVNFYDIIHDIMKQIMISCMISWILYDIMVVQERLDYDIIHDIMVLIVISYMIIMISCMIYCPNVYDIM